MSAGCAFCGQGQVGFRAVPHDRRELLPERVVDLVEHGSRRRKGLCKALPHPDSLAALSREREGDAHPMHPGRENRGR